jgi:hypothetical protein
MIVKVNPLDYICRIIAEGIYKYGDNCSKRVIDIGLICNPFYHDFEAKIIFESKPKLIENEMRAVSSLSLLVSENMFKTIPTISLKIFNVTPGLKGKVYEGGHVKIHSLIFSKTENSKPLESKKRQRE